MQKNSREIVDLFIFNERILKVALHPRPLPHGYTSQKRTMVIKIKTVKTSKVNLNVTIFNRLKIMGFLQTNDKFT